MNSTILLMVLAILIANVSCGGYGNSYGSGSYGKSYGHYPIFVNQYFYENLIK